MKLYLIPEPMIYIIEVNGNRREDMFIDTHMHEMTYSKDSFLKLDEMVSIARQKGLGGICITDHDSMGLKDYAAEYTERTGFPVFVGIEFFSLQGDIVAFGIED